VVQLQLHDDRADTGAAARFNVIDAADLGDHALDRCRQESADGLGARAGIDRRDDDLRALDARELLHRQVEQCPHADQHDDQVHHDREDRVLDEDISE
jgi:hypothetical protein